MHPTRQKLLDMITEPDTAYNMDWSELNALRLDAAKALFTERVEQIPLLKHRAEEAGITEIHSFDDLVPLLFAHTVYKSYPESLVQKGKWPRLLQWLNSLSVPDVSHVDMNGISNIDEWLERLWAADFRVMATSGSSGKCSFMTHTAGDQDRKRRHFKYSVAWPYQVASKDRPVFWTGQIEGPNSAVEAGQFAKMDWAREGEMYVLAKDPLRISEVSKMAAMRKRMAEGTATPEEIADADAETAAKAASGQQELIDFADKVLDHRHEPVYLIGFWAQHLAIVERARERGIGDGEFHPDSLIGAGGGVKGITLADGYQEIVNTFYGDVKRPNVYAMTEMTQALPRCEAGNYHIAPGLIVLLLDESGENLLNPKTDYQGVIEGRFGFLDLAYEGRWGGLITGDKVEIDFSSQCGCGRKGPVVLDTVCRFSQAGGDDKISCAGTIDAYIKGAVDE